MDETDTVGVTGLFTVTARVRTEDAPQELFPVTEIFPDEPAATVLMDMDEEEPVQPPGNVQVYEFAPLTDEME